MTLAEDYFYWLLDIIRQNECEPHSEDLLYALFSSEFVYTLELDKNRAIDGLDLRDEYEASRGLVGRCTEELHNVLGGCSVLEMLIALSIRADDEIMYNENDGNRAYKWFWLMIHNLGLDDLCYPWGKNGREELEYKDIVERFLYRNYESDGRGGLFIVKDRTEDLRKVEIWYQMQWFFNENYEIL